MTNEPSPRPWSFDPAEDTRVIRDANGDEIAQVWNLDADAALIVDAVNERDRLAADEARYRTDNVRLRDIVRRLVDLFTPGTIHPAGTMERLLREARAAIGEDKE